jgi:hypothetical protein
MNDPTISDLIVFQSPRLEKEWSDPRLPPLLRRIVEWVVLKRWQELGLKSIVTSIYRPGDRKPHGSWRAVDLDAVDDRLEEEEEVRLATLESWPTGILRMPRVAPLRHGTGPHHHIQITKGEASL